MSSLNINLNSCSSSSLVEKILEQGQRLRNSMVQAVLKNDPFNKEILNNCNTPRTDIDKNCANQQKCNCDIHSAKCKKSHPDHDQERIHKYLRGDDMCINEEMKALETLRSMSPTSLIHSTSCVKNPCVQNGCCDICQEYEKKLISPVHSTSSSARSNNCLERPTRHQRFQKNKIHDTEQNLRAGLSREQHFENAIKLKSGRETSNVRTKVSTSKLNTMKHTFVENQGVLKFVDSLKINIYSLKFNSAGNKKVNACDSISKPYVTSANTYFVEYTLPDILIKNAPKTRAKVNTGLNPDKTIRFCSKKVQNESVYFKQQSIHHMSNLYMLDLSNIKIEFRVSFRSVKQRTALFIGKASVNLGSLVTNRLLATEQELVVLSENAPVVLGTLKVALHFGCDKLYFGKEFIDAITCTKENSNLSENDSMHNTDTEQKAISVNKQKNDKVLIVTDQNVPHVSKPDLPDNRCMSEARAVQNLNNSETHLLYALIYISEVRLLTNPINSYLICRGFSRDDTVTSKTVFSDCNPKFNVYQLIPVLLDEDFVGRLRDNYLITEVWEKRDEADKLLGISRLSLHQLYIAYRNPAIVRYLEKNKHPVIGVDWWEPVSDPNSNSDTGQLRGLVALGTQAQIETLEQERAIKLFIEKGPYIRKTVSDYREKISSNVSSFKLPVIENVVAEKKIDSLKSFRDKESISKSTLLVSDKYVQEPEIEIFPSVTTLNNTVEETNRSGKVDACTQSETTEIDSEIMDKTPSVNPQLTQRDFLNSFFETLMSARDTNQRNRFVESSTNTDDCLISDNTRTNVAQTIQPQVTNLTNVETVVTNSPTVTASLHNASNANSNLPVRNTSDLLDSLQKALSVSSRNEQNKTTTDCGNGNVASDNFKAHIVIESALHLPSRKKCKSKRNKPKNAKSNEDILPSAYVTFKGHYDSECIVTPVVAKSISPQWDFRCDTHLPSDLLLNNQKRLIFKVWRKANGPSLQPNFQTDIVLGFAALDLTVLLSGLPNVQGWFNIVDFSSKCNGQIKIHVTPLENLSRFNEYKRMCVPEKLQAEPVTVAVTREEPKPDVSEAAVPSELLSRALKRKFTELDEITQRLRQRLTAVTNDDSDVSNDDFLDEFERDLNTECVETEKFSFEPDSTAAQPNDSAIASCSFENSTPELMNALNAAQLFCEKSPNIVLSSGQSDISDSPSAVSEINLPTVHEQVANKKLSELDSHLNEGKLKIDSLLEKLSLLTGDHDKQNKTDRSFSSRYVSGCSMSQESESAHTSQLLKDFALKSSAGFDPDLIFNPMLFQQMYTVSMDSTPRLDDVHYTTLKNLVNDSSSSGSSAADLHAGVEVLREAPDGNTSTDSRL